MRMRASFRGEARLQAEGSAMAPRQFFHQPEPRVVARGFVLAPGIAQTHDELDRESAGSGRLPVMRGLRHHMTWHMRLLLAAFLLRVGSRRRLRIAPPSHRPRQARLQPLRPPPAPALPRAARGSTPPGCRGPRPAPESSRPSGTLMSFRKIVSFRLMPAMSTSSASGRSFGRQEISTSVLQVRHQAALRSSRPGR